MKKIFLKSVLSLFIAITIFMPAFATASECSGQTGIVRCGMDPKTCPCDLCDFFAMLARIYDFIVKGIATPLAVLALIIGAILMMISAGSPNAFGLGKKIVFSAIIGLVLVFCSWLIIDFALHALGYSKNWWSLDLNCSSGGGGGGTCAVGATQACTTGGCPGTQTCTSGTWDPCIKNDPACGGPITNGTCHTLQGACNYTLWPITGCNTGQLCNTSSLQCYDIAGGAPCLTTDPSACPGGICIMGSAAAKYSCSGLGGICAADVSGIYTTSNCDNKCRYSCSAGSCVLNESGAYLLNTCENKCLRYKCFGSACVIEEGATHTSDTCDGACTGGTCWRAINSDSCTDSSSCPPAALCLGNFCRTNRGDTCGTENPCTGSSGSGIIDFCRLSAPL